MSGSDGDRDAADLAGGAEGGMASGSAAGPSQDDIEKRAAKGGTSFEEKTPTTDVESKVGDLGKGSHEQTQGKTRPDES